MPNGIPHDAIILTNSESLDEFKPSKVFSVPHYASSVYPWEVEIHVSGSCCLSCTGCSYGTRHSGESLSVDDVKGVFSSVKNMGSHTVFFSGGGDPLGWKHWDELFELKKQIIPDAAIGISTNLITSIDCGKISRFFDFMQVHIVGFDADSCKENTNVDCFAVMDRQLTALCNPNCVMKVLVTADNHHLIPDYLSYISRFHAKTIVLKMEQDFIANRDSDGNDTFKGLLDAVESHEIVSKYAHVFYTKTDRRSLIMPSKCHIVDKHLYCLIRENGDVYPCICSTYSAKNAVGNIHRARLEEIYANNIDAKRFTDQMQSKECPLGACRHFRFNQVLECPGEIDSCDQDAPYLL